MTLELEIKNEELMLAFGKRLAKVCPQKTIIHFYGDLGAGKTTVVRGFLRGMDYEEAVKSPTYTLVEPYEFDHQKIYHFDLYRLMDPQELEYIGMRDYYLKDAICLIEWPERAEGILPHADLDCYIAFQDEGRAIKLVSNNNTGEKIIAALEENK